MATSSITRNIIIKDKKSCQQLVSALEKADKVRSKEVVFSKAHREIRGDKIKEIFNKH